MPLTCKQHGARIPIAYILARLAPQEVANQAYTGAADSPNGWPLAAAPTAVIAGPRDCPYGQHFRSISV